ncbi:meiosis inhibitor protein 1-like [Anneissia japonica]|uniref:meiosis inhibitor protein 1-like n=1 Tax=Anneissia japonica TaxID=1529436 RepID=UPI0014259AF0|nr:meiosis inhibitor protein 1-like [Anneissia japonica]
MTLLKEPLVNGLIKNLLAVISSARSPEVMMNSLGLLKKVVESERSVHEVIADNHSLVSSAFKKVLLSKNDIHQITVVQCLTHLVMVEQRLNQRTFIESLLSADIAEFLFESLATTNDILLSSIFCCLLVLTDSHEFFQECHAVYGIDSVVRATNHAIKLKNKDILCQGLDLMKKMLERQPTNISLINSSSLLRAMSSLLSSCLRHSQISIVCCAAGVLQELLRKDHLKSPVDFSALEVPLKAIMETWKDLRPLSSLARTKTSRSSTASLTKEDNQNKRYEENKKCLAVGLAVMNSALKLCILCQKDPTSNTSLFRAPNLQLAEEETMDVDQFIQFLLKLLDSSCIPHVMVNYRHLDDANSKFCSHQDNCDVREHVDSFLLNLCQHLLSDDDKTCLPRMQSALKDISCPAYNICGFMREQSSVFNLSSSILDLQSTCLAFMYLAAVYGDPLVNDNEVFESLHFYLSSPNCLVRDLDPTSLKHLMYLYADCYSNASLGEQTPSSLIHVLEKTDASAIYSDHPSVIKWAYSANDVPQNIRRGFFVQWLRNIPSVSTPRENADEECYMINTECGSGGGIDEGRVTDLDSNRSKDECCGFASRLFTNTIPQLDNPASKTLLVEDILYGIMDGDEALLSRCLSLIKASIKATGTDSSSDTARLLQERLPQVVQEMCLKDLIQTTAEMKISAILKLVMEINLRALDSICPVDLKLVYHVSNLLTKSTSTTDTKLVILNFLHCLLFATVHHQDTSVLSVVLSNKPLLQLLENLLKDSDPLDYQTLGSEHLQCSTLSLLATLLQFQHQHQMKGCVPVAVDVNWLINSISTHKPSFQRYAALKFWTAIFETKFATSSLIQLSEGSRRQELLQNHDINLDIKTDHLRLLVIHLQNLIMMDSGSESLSAVACYTALLEYVHNKDQLQGEMLLKQPWNAALLSILLQIQSSSFISPTVVQLYNMVTNTS